MNTVEGAMVFAALTLVGGGAVSGFVTVAQSQAAHALARDVARVEAMGADGLSHGAARDPGARVEVLPENLGGVQAIRVTVSKRAPLFTVQGQAVVVVEPDDYTYSDASGYPETSGHEEKENP